MRILSRSGAVLAKPPSPLARVGRWTCLSSRRIRFNEIPSESGEIARNERRAAAAGIL